MIYQCFAFYQKNVNNNKDDERRGAVARAFLFDQTRDTILNVDCYEIQIYADKYETKFMFGIIKLDLGMTKDQKKEFGLILLYQRLA